MAKIRFFRFPVILLLMIAVLCLVMIGYHLWREYRFAPYIKAASFENDLDPLLVKAVIKRESNFNPRARGTSGEIGLMQVTPTVGREYAVSEGIKGFNRSHLFDPALNIRAGCWYLAKAMKQYGSFSDPVPFALAHYNAGGRNVERWLKKTRHRGDAKEFVKAITYPGTRKYIKYITRRWRRYKLFSL